MGVWNIHRGQEDNLLAVVYLEQDYIIEHNERLTMGFTNNAEERNGDKFKWIMCWLNVSLLPITHLFEFDSLSRLDLATCNS